MNNNNREMTLRFLAQPTDANFGGNVHGGSAMKWLDQAAYACATAWSGHYCVTAFMGDINFHQPVAVGNLVEVKAKIIHTGNTSMHLSVSLRACNPTQCQLSQAIHCLMVFVAVDDNGTPVKVPTWHAKTDEETRMEHYALRIMEMRKINQAALEP
ncbi:MAG: acyl-CoA thioesterase [Mariprofundales bacterium]